jgi:hypothetical protein
MSGIAQREAPHVGIFWVVQTPEAEPRLLAAGCPLDQAEPYGDCLTYGPGHYETWAHWRRDRTGRSLRIAAHHRSTCGAPSVRGGAIVATERRHNAVTRGGVKPGHFRGRTFSKSDSKRDGRRKLGKDLDPFDLICHVAFDRPPLTRRERAENVKKRDVFNKFGGQARAVLDALLAKYQDEGVLNLDDANVLKITPFSTMGSVIQLINAFGGKDGFEQAVHDL